MEEAFEETGLARDLLYKLIRTDSESCGSTEQYANKMISICRQLNAIGFTIAERLVWCASPCCEKIVYSDILGIK